MDCAQPARCLGEQNGLRPHLVFACGPIPFIWDFSPPPSYAALTPELENHLVARMNVQLFVDVLKMKSNGRNADPHVIGNLLIF